MKPSSNLQEILLCADDYSQNKAVCEGILLLAKNKRINAVSCLVNSPLWRETQSQLVTHKENILIGLHLNMTLGKPLSSLWKKHYGNQFSSLVHLLQHTYLKHLNKKTVEAEILSQLETFMDVHGAEPDFIDGHQHVHQLPIIREALLTIYQRLNLNVFCRNTANGWQDLLSFSSFPKRQSISLLGGLTLKRRLKQKSIPTNSNFLGIYNFTQANQYRRYFQQFLKKCNNSAMTKKSCYETLIMCHPGLKSNTSTTDPLHAYRHHELHYLLSDDFLTDLADAHCTIRRPQSTHTI